MTIPLMITAQYGGGSGYNNLTGEIILRASVVNGPRSAVGRSVELYITRDEMLRVLDAWKDKAS